MMASKTRPGSLFVLKKDCMARNKTNSKSGKGDIHVLMGSLWEHGTETSSNPKKIILQSYDNDKIIIVCSVADVEEISPQEHSLLLGITNCSDRLKVLDNKNWLAEGLHMKTDDWVYVIKQKGIPDNTDAIVRYKGNLPGQNGIHFGVELMACRGKGTSNGVFQGKIYFECEENCALFVGLHKLRLNKAAKSPRPKQSENGLLPELTVGDRIIWYSDNGPEHGVVKWIGVLPDSLDQNKIAGVEFDNPIGTGNGKYKEKQLFKAKYKHASLVPICGLMHESEFYSSGSAAWSSDSSYAQSNINGVGVSNSQSSSRGLDGLPGVTKARANTITKHQKDNAVIIEDQNRLLKQVNRTPASRNSSGYNSTKAFVNGHSTQRAGKSYVWDSYSAKNKENDANLQHGARPKSTPMMTDHKEKLASSYSAVNQKRPGAGKGASYPNGGGSVKAPDSLSQLSSWSDEGDIEVGDMVEVNYQQKRYGVVRWIGVLPYSKDPTKKVCGLEMEDAHPSYNDGTFGDVRYFNCPESRGHFVYHSKVRRDSRFIENPKYVARTNSLAFGSMLSPDVQGNLAPLTSTDTKELCGRHKGIQGHHNSCYLDSTLFTMFAFTSVFDSVLYRLPREGEMGIYHDIQNVMKNSIVNPLRKNFYVRADKVVQLRRYLDEVGSVKGMMTEEKDPEEFLTLLLEKVMRADPFITLSSGQESYFYQLFIEKDERLQLPTTQQLLELSFMESDVKLRETPSCLILQMPRFGKDYKMYQRIMPSLTLDITDILEYGTRECTICGTAAEWECKKCYKEFGESLSKIAYCTACNARSHGHVKRQDHKPKQLKVPQDFLYNFDGNIVPREELELFGVICIQTSHYVSFVKCGQGKEAPWVFFDSMADRMGEANGYNVPEVKLVPNFTDWLSEESLSMLSKIKDDREIEDPYMRRLLCDAYVCMYQSREVQKYQA